jgi:hypothetical protein
MNGKEEKINKHAKLIRRRHFPFQFFLYINIEARGRKNIEKKLARNGNKAKKEDYKTN